MLRSRWDEWFEEKADIACRKMERTLKGSQTTIFHCWSTPKKGKILTKRRHPIAKLAVSQSVARGCGPVVGFGENWVMTNRFCAQLFNSFIY